MRQTLGTRTSLDCGLLERPWARSTPALGTVAIVVCRHVRSSGERGWFCWRHRRTGAQGGRGAAERSEAGVAATFPACECTRRQLDRRLFRLAARAIVAGGFAAYDPRRGGAMIGGGVRPPMVQSGRAHFWSWAVASWPGLRFLGLCLLAPLFFSCTICGCFRCASAPSFFALRFGSAIILVWPCPCLIEVATGHVKGAVRGVLRVLSEFFQLWADCSPSRYCCACAVCSLARRSLCPPPASLRRRIYASAGRTGRLWHPPPCESSVAGLIGLVPSRRQRASPWRCGGRMRARAFIGGIARRANWFCEDARSSSRMRRLDARRSLLVSGRLPPGPLNLGRGQSKTAFRRGVPKTPAITRAAAGSFAWT